MSSTTTKKLALVTGASSGIGKELARYHAKQGGDLIISARRTSALEELKTELEKAHEGIKVHIVTADLSQMDGAQKLYDEITSNLKLKVDYLVNNAGLGGHGTILERDVKDDINMIIVNIVSLVTLTHLFAKDMAAAGGGKILNLGSTAGFMPGPSQAVYFATKAFVQSFSQAVDQELKAKGVTSTVLCPGLVTTEFVATAGLEGTDLANQKGDTPENVAKIGYDAMMAEKLVIVNEYGLSFFLQWVTPLMPRRLILKMGDQMQTKK